MMLGVCYYPEQWPEAKWADDAARMRELGLTWVRIAEFAWMRMEPEPGAYDFAWLDRVIGLLADQGLKVVLGTPTAAPPKWLCDGFPKILPVDADGRRRRFGGRRHYDFSSPDWWRESARIVTVMARRYGNDPRVMGWQLDNEFGCHDTTLSYSKAAAAAFRRWLEERYGTVARLNEAWGNAFWGMGYRSFAEIDPPNLVIAEAAPMHSLDFRRFSSAQVTAYGDMQCAILREHSPGRFVTHNFMNFFTAYDPFAVAESHDLASWDSYPLGQTETHLTDDAVKDRWARTAHPDIPSFGSDTYRGVGRGRFWIMEHQPGPVNWAARNPSPAPGAVRLWTWQAFAHGAEVVSYFRWRQLPYAQEQMHAGLNRADDVLDSGGLEAARVARELAAIPLPATTPSPVALVLDYEAHWIWQIQPLVQSLSYIHTAWSWYSAARGLGIDVDIVRPGADLRGYRLVLVPGSAVLRPEVIQSFAMTEAVMLYGARTGSKTPDFAIPPELAPGPLQALIPVKVARVDTLRPAIRPRVSGGVDGHAVSWRELIESDLDPLARFEDGHGALYAHGRHLYLACCPDDELARAVMVEAAGRAGLPVRDLPDGLRLRRRGNLTFALNFGDETVQVPAPDGAEFVLGGRALGPVDVAAWRD